MDGSTSSEKRLKSLQLLSLLLPPLNRYLFKKIIGLLHLVSEKTINLMTSKNLAVVFAPNIAAKTVWIWKCLYWTNKLALFYNVHYILWITSKIISINLFDKWVKTPQIKFHQFLTEKLSGNIGTWKLYQDKLFPMKDYCHYLTWLHRNRYNKNKITWR